MALRNLLGLSLLLLLLPSLEAAATGDRQFILIFDAGSTGTRLGVFEFRLDCNHSTGLRLESWNDTKSSNGLSSFANAPERLRDDLKPLMDFAKKNVPADLHANTTAIVRATAGLRVLNDVQRRGIIRVVAEILRRSTFKVPEQDYQAVGILSGQEEAEYGWVAVNYLMGTFDKPDGNTFGMLDLGGGSTQIAFQPEVDNLCEANRLVFKTVRGQSFPLYARSYLNLGRDQALSYMFKDNYDQRSRQPSVYLSKCLNPRFTDRFIFKSDSIPVAGDNQTLAADRPSLCSRLARVPLMWHQVFPAPASKAPQFVAVGSFYYTAKSLKSYKFWDREIPGNATLSDLKAAADKVCLNPPLKGRHDPYLCMSAWYAVTLLEIGYNLPLNQSLYFANKINGITTGWSLGLAIDELKPKVVFNCGL